MMFICSKLGDGLRKMIRLRDRQSLKASGLENLLSGVSETIAIDLCEPDTGITSAGQAICGNCELAYQFFLLSTLLFSSLLFSSPLWRAHSFKPLE